MFLEILYSYICNFADDTSASVCGTNIEEVLHDLEEDAKACLIWYENNYMKSNPGKCHFITNGSTEHLWIRVGNEKIWESFQEKPLGILVDKNLSFKPHLKNLCKKVGQKISALSRLVKIMPFHRRKTLMNSFILSQFNYCPLIWMFWSRSIDRRINHLHERALRLVYHDYASTFENLLEMDGSLRIHYRCIHRVAIEMYKFRNNLSPTFMSEILQDSEPALCLKSGDTFLRPRIVSVKYGEYSLRSFGPIVWNHMLPTHLKESENLEKFKYEIRRWVPRNCPCRLCKTYLPNIGFL